MAFNDLELKRIDQVIGEYLRNRVPPEHRDKLQYDIQISGHNVLLRENRPRWDKPDEWLALEFAKLRYIRNRDIWMLYWKRASGKWELYEPKGEAKNLKTLVDAIEEDRFGCFFG
jgi:hypothetical protein